MANVSITAANVVPGADATTTYGTAGATITAEQTVYQKASDSEWYLADCDATAVAGNA